MTLHPEPAQSIPDAVVTFCSDHKLGAIISIEDLKGGAVSVTQRLTTGSGASIVLKRSPQPPADLYQREAEGLQMLAMHGLPTPEVLIVGSDFLLLEDVGSAPADEIDWEQLGRSLAHLHQHQNDRFGFENDNYLGLLPQWNSWTADGHQFFVQNRILRYLSVPACAQVLTREDRSKLDRFVNRLSQLIPVQPACLLHGDLWRENTLADRHRVPTVIDPAVYFGWPEAELSMAQQYPGIPRSFFDAYVEVNPLEAGWWERLEILYVREILSILAHFGDRDTTALAWLRSILDEYT
jgi:fructosamine-3-kinase